MRQGALQNNEINNANIDEYTRSNKAVLGLERPNTMSQQTKGFQMQREQDTETAKQDMPFSLCWFLWKDEKM